MCESEREREASKKSDVDRKRKKAKKKYRNDEGQETNASDSYAERKLFRRGAEKYVKNGIALDHIA